MDTCRLNLTDERIVTINFIHIMALRVFLLAVMVPINAVAYAQYDIVIVGETPGVLWGPSRRAG